MYDMTLTDCVSFDHALAMKLILAADGFPVVAATIRVETKGLPPGDVHVVAALAPRRYAELSGPVALAFARQPGGLDKLRAKVEEWGHSNERRTSPCHLSALRLMQDALANAGTVVRMDPPYVPVHTDHDPGDEHSDINTNLDGAPSLAAVRGTSTTDAWDCWKAAR